LRIRLPSEAIEGTLEIEIPSSGSSEKSSGQPQGQTPDKVPDKTKSGGVSLALPLAALSATMLPLIGSQLSAGKTETGADAKKEEMTLNAGTVHLNIQEANFRNGSVSLSAEGYGGKSFSPNVLV
jgi:hypothetical protein